MFWIWPAHLGGDTTMVVVSGDSMLPTLKSDDLVVARAADTYDVGDIVIYAIPGNGVGAERLIIHRIVGGDSTGYVIRGDNRTTDDSWNPTAGDIVGQKVMTIPDGGGILRKGAALIMWPVTWGLFVSVLVAAFVWKTSSNDETDFDQTTPSEPSSSTGDDPAPMSPDAVEHSDQVEPIDAREVAEPARA